MRDEVELGELMHVLVDGLPQLRHTDQLSDLVGPQVVQTLPGEGFLTERKVKKGQKERDRTEREKKVFTQLRHTDQLSDLVGPQVVQTLPREGFLTEHEV